MTDTIRDALFSVIRAAMGEGTPPPAPDADTCAELLRIASRQAILPIVYDGLRQIGAPDQALSPYENARLRDGYYTIQREDALSRVSAALDSAEVPYVLLKGAVLRLLYPDPDWRTSCDIDVLVERARLDEAIGALESDTDFYVKDRGYHDVSMVNALIHLELHFSIKENMESIDRLLTAAWDHTGPTGEGSRYAFSPEYQLFHVVAHMCHHLLSGGLGIRPFLDLWLLRTRVPYDEEAVRRMCEECGVLTLYDECCRLTRIWMEGADYTDTARLFERFCLSGGVFGSDEFAHAARQRQKRGIRYIWSRIFPPAYQVREFYADPTGRQHVLLYYYVKRLTSWLSKRRRKELSDQVRSVMSSDPAYLDAADDLLRRLDLSNAE